MVEELEDSYKDKRPYVLLDEINLIEKFEEDYLQNDLSEAQKTEIEALHTRIITVRVLAFIAQTEKIGEEVDKLRSEQTAEDSKYQDKYDDENGSLIYNGTNIFSSDMGETDSLLTDIPIASLTQEIKTKVEDAKKFLEKWRDEIGLIKEFLNLPKNMDDFLVSAKKFEILYNDYQTANGNKTDAFLLNLKLAYQNCMDSAGDIDGLLKKQKEDPAITSVQIPDETKAQVLILTLYQYLMM